jgi:hypothetical protein
MKLIDKLIEETANGINGDKELVKEKQSQAILDATKEMTGKDLAPYLSTIAIKKNDNECVITFTIPFPFDNG